MITIDSTNEVWIMKVGEKLKFPAEKVGDMRKIVHFSESNHVNDHLVMRKNRNYFLKKMERFLVFDLIEMFVGH